jgi:CubicO group peptidase (beta-lactamase class C family)
VVLLLGAFTVWVYIPSPTFEPPVYEPIRPEYWPTEGFRTATPEAHGMDAAQLVAMVRAYEENHAKNPANSIDAIIIIRNGYVVADLYFNPLYPRDTPHVMHSATKSVVSALIGIAMEQGYIESVDTPVVTFFADRDLEIADGGIVDVTLKDLLTMQTGIRSRDSYLYQWDGWFEMQAADDWVAYFFSLPMDTEPGTRFDYSNLASFMLSAIIQQVTGMDTLTYARENLFDPLGIDSGDVFWETSPRGIYIGAARMWLKPHDMAKFGLLYLQKGQWDGQQIVPAGWIEASVTPHAYPKTYVDILNEQGKKDWQASQMAFVSNKFLKHFADGYGYQWWLDKHGNYNALGTSGQYLIVAPEANLVVMVANSSYDMGVFFPGKLFYDYILPSVKSDTAIEPNAAAQRELAALSDPPALHQVPQPVPELPATALAVSGKTYTLETNKWNYDNLRLVFDPALDEAEFSFTRRLHESASFRVGLDGVYRYTETEIGTMAATGAWTAPDTFEVSFRWIGYSATDRLIMTFDGDAIEVTEVGLTGSSTFAGRPQ